MKLSHDELEERGTGLSAGNCPWSAGSMWDEILEKDVPYAENH